MPAMNSPAMSPCLSCPRCCSCTCPFRTHKLPAAWALGLILAGVLAPNTGCIADPDADLLGPHIVHASPCVGDRVIEVWPQLSLTFSEPIDPTTVTSGALALVASQPGPACDAEGRCQDGVCAQGRCWLDPLASDASDASDDLAEGVFTGGVPLRAWWPETGRTQLSIQPHLPLQPNARYHLIASTFIRDDNGSALVVGESGVWSCGFQTADRTSSGPQAQLVWPMDGSSAVPTDLASVWVVFERAVEWDTQSTLELQADDGSKVILQNPRSCADGFEFDATCVALTPEQPLQPGTHYRPGAGTFLDEMGRGAIAPAADVSGFRTGAGPLVEGSSLAGLSLSQQGPCLMLQRSTPEAIAVSIQSDVDAWPAIHHLGSGFEMAIRTGPEVMAGGRQLVSVSAIDLAGREVGTFRELISVPVLFPELVITEVLANPRGPEPGAEYVEVLDIRTSGEPLTISGLWLADLSWQDVQAELAQGETPGDPVPEFVSEPGQYTLIVGSGFVDRGNADPPPMPQTAIVTLASSLGDGGLTNAGEPVTLYVAAPHPVLISRYGDHLQASGSGFNGRAFVRRDPLACDVASAWQISADGSTPGWSDPG